MSNFHPLEVVGRGGEGRYLDYLNVIINQVNLSDLVSRKLGC